MDLLTSHDILLLLCICSTTSRREVYQATFYKQREDLNEWEKRLNKEEEKLTELRRMLNQREEKVNENDRLFKQKERSLEELQNKIDLSTLKLKEMEEDIGKRMTDLVSKEKVDIFMPNLVISLF